MKILRLSIISLSFFTLFACKEEKHGPLFSGDKPNAISQYTVENLPGAAAITFKIDDRSTAYVKALYTLEHGRTREAKASKFENILMVDGFAESREYPVTVYAVGYDEEESEPLHITVHPSTPPYQSVLSEMKVVEDWGGGKIMAPNPMGAQLMISVVKKNKNTGQWEDVEVYFSESKNLNFNFRGQAPVETEFGVFTRDKWQNYSDTVSFVIEPWEEIKLPIDPNVPAHFSISLPGDAAQTSNTYGKRTMFDGRRASYADGFYSANDGTPYPKFVTLDLLRPYQLSRFKYWMNGPTVYYQTANMKHIRIWGNNEPNVDPSTWILLGEWDDWKPSGRPVGAALTDEDLEKALAGNDFDFPLGIPAVRYIRIEAVTSWEPRTRLQIPELEIYGRPVD